MRSRLVALPTSLLHPALLFSQRPRPKITSTVLLCASRNERAAMIVKTNINIGVIYKGTEITERHILNFLISAAIVVFVLPVGDM